MARFRAKTRWFRALTVVLVVVITAACSSDGPGGDANAAPSGPASTAAIDRGTVLVEARFVNAAGAGVPGLRIQITAVASSPGLSQSPVAAMGTTDADGRFTASAVPAESVAGAAAGTPVRFVVFAFGGTGDRGTWGCSFTRSPHTNGGSGAVAWEGPVPSLVFRPDATCTT